MTMVSPRLQREFDRLWSTPNRMLTEREITVLFDGVKPEPHRIPFWFYALAVATAVYVAVAVAGLYLV